MKKPRYAKSLEEFAQHMPGELRSVQKREREEMANSTLDDEILERLQALRDGRPYMPPRENHADESDATPRAEKLKGKRRVPRNENRRVLPPDLKKLLVGLRADTRLKTRRLCRAMRISTTEVDRWKLVMIDSRNPTDMPLDEALDRVIRITETDPSILHKTEQPAFLRAVADLREQIRQCLHEGEHLL